MQVLFLLAKIIVLFFIKTQMLLFFFSNIFFHYLACGLNCGGNLSTLYEMKQPLDDKDIWCFKVTAKLRGCMGWWVTRVAWMQS